MSSEDLREGSRWTSELAVNLESADLGILCVTKENVESEWLIFEAGALSKGTVVPVLVDLTPTDLPGTLGQFQAISWTENGLRKLAEAINHELGEDRLRESELAANLESQPLPRVISRRGRRPRVDERAEAKKGVAKPLQLDGTALSILQLTADAPEDRFLDHVDIDELVSDLREPLKKIEYYVDQLANAGLVTVAKGSVRITNPGTAELLSRGLM